MENISLLIALLTLSVSLFYYVRRKRNIGLPSPPGPNAWPIVGNIFDLPVETPWITYRDWSKKYGSDIIFLDLPNQPTVILNSAKAILDLMEGRSRCYADRRLAEIDTLTGWEWNLGLMPYGSRWRSIRRVVHQHFNQYAVQQYRPIECREVSTFLKRAAASCADGQNLDVKIVGHTFAAIILDITYGMKIQEYNNEFLSLSQKAVEAITLGRLAGAFYVEYFPWLNYIPSWMPGSSARRFGERYIHTVQAARRKGFDGVMEDTHRGSVTPSISAKLIEQLQELEPGSDTYKDAERTAIDATGIVYAAAVDTQLSAMSSFILAMSLNPQVQRKAQQELDVVVGPTRLPTTLDLKSLPFIQAILLEVLRWRPAAPLGVPRSALEDDVYGGYAIPAGTIVIANLWAVLHDPEEYEDPDVFNPDRFIRNGTLNPEVRSSTIGFGVGRRICPGRHLALETLSLIIASTLHVFNIESAPCDTSTDASTGFLSYPSNLPCRLTPRSKDAMALIAADSD